MKRFLAIALTLILVASLFPAGIVANAEKVTEKPFYLANWSAPEGDPKYIFGMPGSWVNAANIKADSTAAENAPVAISGSGSSVQAAAQKMYDILSKCPEGARYFNFAAQRTLFLAHCKDLVDIRHGVELTKNWVEALLYEYKKLGGELDGILVDLEYNDASTYYINANYYSKKNNPNKNIYNDIANNEYYKTVMRPILVERGFVFYENPDPAKYPYRSELWTLESCNEEGANSKSQSIWNQLIQEHLATAMTVSVYEPLIKFYPDAVVSDYKTGDSYRWFKGMGHTGSESGYNTIKAGNVSNYNFYDYATGYLFYGYSSETNRTKRTQYRKPASYNDAYFADAPYDRTNWEINTMKRLLASTDTGKVNAWITFFNYGTYGPGYSRTPYYSELIYHLGMTNPEPFIGYILKNEVLDKGYDDPHPDVCEYDYNLKVVDELLGELTRVAGASDRKAIVTPITWNEGFILSGMYAGGRNIWRVTPNTDEISVADFKVKDKAPTFKVDGVTITFPQGRIISDSKITHVGTCGYWVETPANVVPVVTSTADRYQNDPSFHESFDYATGAFTSNSTLPDTFWTVSGSASIVENGGNKAVQLTGNASITNTKIVKLITAGDYYAKQQAWEVTVSLPSGNYGEVKLFSTGNADGGIKISGGKVYYDDAGTYKELSGVTLSAGTYTFKRELDVRTEGSYKCSYTVYDASGNRVGGADNAALAPITIPATEIKIAVSGASDGVKFDDYKLYPTGVTANLDLYDAALGRTLADPTAAQTQDLGYRLSWMNASSQYKVAKIMDAKSGKVLKTVNMAPGMDGIVTGIAKSDGAAIQIVVDVQDGTAPTLPNYDSGNFDWPTMEEYIQNGGNMGGGNTDSGNGGNGGNTGDTGNAGGNDGVIDFDNIGNTPAPDNGNTGDGNGTGNTNTDGANKENNTNTVPAETIADGAADPNADKREEKSGLGAGMIVLIICVGVAVLAGAGIAVYFFVIKPKKAKTILEESVENNE